MWQILLFLKEKSKEYIITIFENLKKKKKKKIVISFE